MRWKGGRVRDVQVSHRHGPAKLHVLPQRPGQRDLIVIITHYIAVHIQNSTGVSFSK